MINQSVGTQKYYEMHYSSRDLRLYKYFLSDFILLSEPGSILDVGAGVGFIVEGCTQWGLDCVGIEGFKEAVEIAYKRYPGIRLTQHFLSDPFQFSNEV